MRARIEQGERDLVRNDLDAALHRDPQVRGVEVGDSEMPDEAFALQVLKMEEGVEPGGVGVHPGMELQEIDAVGAEPFQRSLDRLPHVFARNRPRLRRPLREPLGAISEDPGDDFGRAIVVGHVESGEAGVDIGTHGQGRLVHVELARRSPLEVGDLPEAVDDAARP